MDKILHVATVNRLEYYPLKVSGIAIQNTLACIFELFDVQIDPTKFYADKYEVERKQLQDMQQCIVSQNDYFYERSNDFENYLAIANIDKDKFLHILSELINMSDQQNHKILISWSDKDNTPIDLDIIKSIQLTSEVTLGETLAFVPADGLSLEKAFLLYVQAMYWGEGDCFYQVLAEEDGLKIVNSDCIPMKAVKLIY